MALIASSSFSLFSDRADGGTLTYAVIGLVQFILGGGVQVQADRSVLSGDEVKGRPVGGGQRLHSIRKL